MDPNERRPFAEPSFRMRNDRVSTKTKAMYVPYTRTRTYLDNMQELLEKRVLALERLPPVGNQRQKVSNRILVQAEVRRLLTEVVPYVVLDVGPRVPVVYAERQRIAPQSVFSLESPNDKVMRENHGE